MSTALELMIFGQDGEGRRGRKRGGGDILVSDIMPQRDGDVYVCGGIILMVE